MLGVKIDSQLKFNIHLESNFKKARQKVHVSARITPYMCIRNMYKKICKRKLLMKAFFKDQFSYCSLVWMCHSRSMNNNP